MALYNNLGKKIICLSFVLSSVCSEDVCVQRTPCMCVFPNGTGVDLTPTAGAFFYAAPAIVHENKDVFTLFTFYYHPCSDLMPLNQTTDPGDTCKVPLAVYRVVTRVNQTVTGTVCNYMGQSENIDIANDGRSITYYNGPASTKVLLNCARGDVAGDNQLSLTSLADPGAVLLTFYSSHACLKEIEPPSSGRSFDSTLLSIFKFFSLKFL